MWSLARYMAGLLAAFCFACGAAAHEVRPAYLEITQTGLGEHSVVWKQPVANGQRLRINPVFPDTCEIGPDRVSASDGVLVRRFDLNCDLTRGTIAVEGLDRTLTDVFIRITGLEGETRSAVLRPNALDLDLVGPTAAATAAYVQIGVEHIWFGWDHLLFVLGIMLLVERRQLLLTITAFTVAHSITLGLSAIGGISLPGPPVEIVIALSISLLGLESIYKMRGRQTFAARRPWLVAGLFGLIHGFGFAGALAEIGLPKQSEILALLLFNLGVEAGQLAIIAAVLAGVRVMRRLELTKERTAHLARFAGAYTLGIIGMYWAVERTVGTFFA